MDLPSRFTPSQDVNIQTTLVINSIHARLRIMTEIERILAVYDTQVSLGQHMQVAIKGNYMRKLVLKNLGLPSVEHKVVVLSTKN